MKNLKQIALGVIFNFYSAKQIDKNFKSWMFKRHVDWIVYAIKPNWKNIKYLIFIKIINFGY